MIEIPSYVVSFLISELYHLVSVLMISTSRGTGFVEVEIFTLNMQHFLRINMCFVISHELIFK